MSPRLCKPLIMKNEQSNKQTKTYPPLQLNKGIHKRPCWCIFDGGYVWYTLRNTTMDESLECVSASVIDEMCT